MKLVLAKVWLLFLVWFLFFIDVYWVFGVIAYIRRISIDGNDLFFFLEIYYEKKKFSIDMKNVNKRIIRVFCLYVSKDC